MPRPHARVLCSFALVLSAGLLFMLPPPRRSTSQLPPLPEPARERGREPDPAESKTASAALTEAETLGARALAREAYGRLPLQFEANRGQADARVGFITSGGGYDLFLTPAEAVFSLSRDTGRAAQQGADANARAGRVRHARAPDVLRLKFVGASESARLEGREELTGKSNYFSGGDPARWITGIPNYASVYYRGIYDGVDATFYGNRRQLEYDFIVKPGADPSVIRLTLEGAREVRVEDGGELVARTQSGGEVRQHKPFIYQETGGGRREIAGRYVIGRRNEVGFEVGAYDRSKPLIIDPVLVYSSYLGGNNYDTGNDIAVDAAGNAYVTGHAGSRNFPTTAGAFQQTKGQASAAAFVTKINPEGTAIVYSTYFRGEGWDGYVTGYGIAVDAQGNAYVTGEASTLGFPTTPGAPDDTPYDWDAFITKLNPQGSGLVYSTLLGGSYADHGRDIAVDAGGNAYVTGLTACPAPTCDFPAVNAFQPQHGGRGGYDAFVTKINPEGTAYVYSTYLGGGSDLNAHNEWGYGIAVDAQGSAYVTGFTNSPDFPTTPAAYDRTRNATDAFVTKFAPDGRSLAYSTFLGGNGSEQGYDIALDADGNAYVTGSTTSYDFPVTAGAFQTAGSFDAFVTKLNAAGSALVYSTYLGGAGGEDRAWGIALDSARNAYVVGDTRSGDFPVRDAVQPSYGGGLVDGFASKLNASGTALVYSTFIGGFDFDEARGVAVDSAGSVYVTGYTSSANFHVTAGAFQTTPGGTNPDEWPHPEDAFVIKLADGVTPSPTPTPTPSNNPPTARITSPANNSTFNINTDVTITAEASDSDGSVSKVIFYADFAPIGTDTTAPYSVTVRDFAENTRNYWAAAVDDRDVRGANSPTVTINFVDPNPTLYITGRVLHAESSPERPIPIAGATMTVTRFTTGAVVKTALTDAEGFYSVGPLSQGAALDLTASKDGYTMLPPMARWSGLFPGATQDFEAHGPLPPGTPPGDPNAPPTAWAASYNGPANDADSAARVAADGAGNVYVTGASNNAPGETADKDIVTVKYGPDGSQLWARRFSGAGGYIDVPTAIAVSLGGAVYVAGYAWNGATDYDYVLIKYLHDGTQVWARYYDGPVHRGDQATSLKLDGAGNAYVTGYSTGGAVGVRVNFGYATVKYDVNGTQLWARRFEGHNQCGAGAEDLELDGAGGVYVTGSVTPGDCGGEKNIYTIKYDGNGNQLWAAEFDSPQGAVGVDLDTALGLSVDRQGHACVFGFNWPGDRRRDFLLLKYDAAGGLLWSRNWSGPDDDIIREIAVDSGGNIYATGDALEADSPSQNTQAVTVKYGPDGTLLWERTYGTLDKWDGDNRMVMDGAGNVYVALQSQTGADYDFTTIKYTPDGSRAWVHRLAGFSNDLVSDIALDAGGNLYLTGRSTAANQTTNFLTMKLAAAASPNSPPTVSLTSPAEGASFTVPASVTLTADAFDGDGTITAVGFYADTTLNGSPSKEWLGEVNTPPYAMEFMNGAAGSYTITAVAWDDAGASTTSAPVHVTFVAQTPTPTPTPAPGVQDVLWTNLINASASGGSVEHNGGGYYAMARSQQTLSGPGHFEWTFDGDDCVVGLGNKGDETASAIYFDLDFAIELHPQGYGVREFGAYRNEGPIRVGDVFRIEIAADGDVLYKRNGQTIHATSNPAKVYPYYLVFKAWEFPGSGISGAKVASSGAAPTPTPTPMPTPTPTPTPAPTPTPTPAPGTARAIVFDGVTQRGRATMPAAPAFTPRGAYRVEGRVRSLRLNHSGTQMLFELFRPSTEQEQGKLLLTASNYLSFSVRGGSPLILGGQSDFLFRAQFDPAAGRATLETWNLDGTNYRASADAVTDASPLDMGGAQLTVAANYYNLFNAGVKLDWLRMLDGAVPLAASAVPADAPPAGAAQLWRYEFEGNGLDASGTGAHLTLDNAPAFEDTPPTVSASGNAQQAGLPFTVTAARGGPDVKDLFYSLYGSVYRKHDGPFYVEPSAAPVVYAFAED